MKFWPTFLCHSKWKIVAAFHTKFGLHVLTVYKMSLSTFQLLLFYFFWPSVSDFIAQSHFSLLCLKRCGGALSIVRVGEEDPKLPESNRLVQQCGRLSKLTDTGIHQLVKAIILLFILTLDG